MGTRSLRLVCVFACFVATSARAQPRAPACEQQLQALSQVLEAVGVASRPAAIAAFTRAAELLRAARKESPADAAACERALEPLLRSQALAARAEDHLHQNTPGAEVLLALHQELFPTADRDGVVAYELGNSIADLTRCGCQGRKNDAARWQQVLAAYESARAAPDASKTQVRWMGKTMPLPEALQLGEALARTALEGRPTEQRREKR